MPLYAATIFLSAFLLFLVQPVISKQILPWFGGAASVWTTCLVFFQMSLLAGYAYTDAFVRRATQRRQVIVHSILLVGSLAILPITPGVQWKPSGGENPLWLILGMLATTVWLPYFLLSTTSPFVQSWIVRAMPGTSPYRLFALSNLASMLALLGYPFVIEPWASTRSQGLAWSVGYALFVLICVATAWISLRRATLHAGHGSTDVEPTTMTHERPEPLPLAGESLWFVLAAAASVLLLAVTNQITRNIAAIPLLWIGPLAIYLLTFIIAFDGSAWYRRGLVIPLAATGTILMALPLNHIFGGDRLLADVGAFLVGLFAVCMFAHGELARLKPAPRHLTRFYLVVSLGGATGAALVGIAAPLVLPAYFELPVGLVLCALLIYWQIRSSSAAHRAAAVAMILVTVFFATANVRSFYSGTERAMRNFYGVLRVQDSGSDSDERRRTLIDGTTVHGTQLLAPGLRARPTTYYSATSGIGRILNVLKRNKASLHVGLIGLGAGTLATYGRQSDVYRFYEINPDVIAIANDYFTFLKDSAAKISTILGDARLALERESPQRFDLLVVDAFSSDAIPVHLMTFEAVALYRSHLNAGGVMAFHVSNRFLDLVPVVETLGNAHELGSATILDPGGIEIGSGPSHWVLLGGTPETFEAPEIAGVKEPPRPVDAAIPWTDDRNSLVQTIR